MNFDIRCISGKVIKSKVAKDGLTRHGLLRGKTKEAEDGVDSFNLAASESSTFAERIQALLQPEPTLTLLKANIAGKAVSDLMALNISPYHKANLSKNDADTFTKTLLNTAAEVGAFPGSSILQSKVMNELDPDFSKYCWEDHNLCRQTPPKPNDGNSIHLTGTLTPVTPNSKTTTEPNVNGNSTCQSFKKIIPPVPEKCHAGRAKMSLCTLSEEVEELKSLEVKK